MANAVRVRTSSGWQDIALQGAPGVPSSVPLDTWHVLNSTGEPSFVNNWGHYGGGEQSVAFRKFPDGKVRLRGLALKTGTPVNGEILFTLPQGYQPAAGTPRWACAGYNGSVITTTYIYVAAVDRTVRLWTGASPGMYIDLSSVEFDTESVTQMPSGPSGTAGPAGGQALTQLIGDGFATSFSITHNFNQRNVMVSVFRTAAPFDEVMCDIERTDVNTVTVRTAPTVPAVNEYTVTVQAAGTNTLAAVTMDTWHVVGAAGEPAFSAGWSNWGSGLSNCGFRKYPDGRIALRGVLWATTAQAANSIIFTLPVGYRPAADIVLDQGTSSGGLGIVIGANGTVKIIAALAINAQVWLDGASFDTESVTQVASVAAQPMDSWHQVGAAGEPALGSGVTNKGGPEAPLGFRKFPDGRVQLRGVVNTASGPTVLFILPSGYRPPLAQGYARFTCIDYNTNNLCYIYISSSDGAVTKQTSGVTTVDLSTISFDTELVTAYVAGQIGPQRVTSLPANPFDGQEVYLVADAGPPVVLWHLRRNVAAAKWEYVGGSPITYRLEGENPAYAGITGSGVPVCVNATYNKQLAWVFTPPMDCWADVDFELGLIGKTDAAYHYSYFTAQCSPSPASGSNGYQVYRTQHSQVQQYENYPLHTRFALTAGVTYTINVTWTFSGGTWQIHQAASSLWMTGKAWPR